MTGHPERENPQQHREGDGCALPMDGKASRDSGEAYKALKQLCHLVSPYSGTASHRDYGYYRVSGIAPTSMRFPTEPGKV
jgi:hypothetical protein